MRLPFLLALSLLPALAQAAEPCASPRLGLLFFDQVPVELKSPKRAVVRYVASGSPAAKVGMRALDLVTSVDGREMTSGAQAVQALEAALAAGKCPEVHGWRGDKSFTVACIEPKQGAASDEKSLLAGAAQDTPVAVISGDCPSPGTYLLTDKTLQAAINLSLNDRADEHITACAEKVGGAKKICGSLDKFERVPTGSWRVKVTHPAHGPMPLKLPEVRLPK